MAILIAGELNPDLILSGCPHFPEPGKEVLVKDAHLTLGSSSAICAVGLARLGDRVTFVANTGADAYGDFCISALEREGIDVSLIRRRPDLQTGITVSITSARDRALVTHLGAISSLTADDVPVELFAGFQHIHIAAYFLQDGLRPGIKDLFTAARTAGLTTSLDCGYDPTEKWSKDLIETLTEVDLFLPNESEVMALTGSADLLSGLDALDNGHTLVVAKLGSKGCITRHQGELIRVDAIPLDVVDTTGAGDSFDAGFLHAWLRNKEIGDCMRFATACGSLSTRGVGGTGAQPQEHEVEACLKTMPGVDVRCSG